MKAPGCLYDPQLIFITNQLIVCSVKYESFVKNPDLLKMTSCPSSKYSGYNDIKQTFKELEQCQVLHFCSNNHLKLLIKYKHSG